jgi:hypothetical protein
MDREWQTFVRKFEDLKEGEVELFVKDLTPGSKKYNTRHVRATVAKAKGALPEAELLWIRSESGITALEPWYIRILEELPAWVPGKPWENVLDITEKVNKGKSKVR